jgi:UDP-N-acetylglucosamine:LPS N-acetylglucosamine transferase
VLLDVWALRPWWGRHTTRWVAVPAADTLDLLADQEVEWADELRPADLVALLRATVRAFRALRGGDIELLVSAGGGVAVPYFLAARVTRVPTWWVETLNVSGGAGLAARLCCRLADRVVVQHDELLVLHRRSVHVGELY